jgi:tRNA/rRNA methyltransferase
MSDRQVPPPAVVLVRPQEDGNVGAVARAMANMGLERLLLVEPAVKLGPAARAFAVKAGHILDAAERYPSLAAALGPFERVVGTTSSRSRQLGAPLLTPRAAALRLAAAPVPAALVFGPESSGLTTDELALCSPLVCIPAALAQPTLNLAQAVLILAYELYLLQDAGAGAADEPGLGEAPTASAAGGSTGTLPASNGDSADPDAAPAPVAQIDGLFAQLAPLLAAIGFARDDTYHGVERDLRRLAARSAISRREVAILRGICRRAEHALRRLGGRSEGL